jgi:hypothetical protein
MFGCRFKNFINIKASRGWGLAEVMKTEAIPQSLALFETDFSFLALWFVSYEVNQ